MLNFLNQSNKTFQHTHTHTHTQKTMSTQTMSTQLDSSLTKLMEMAKAKQLNHQTKKQFTQIFDLVTRDYVESRTMHRSLETIGNVMDKCINQDSRYNIKITVNPNFIVSNLKRIKKKFPTLNVMDMPTFKQHVYHAWKQYTANCNKNGPYIHLELGVWAGMIQVNNKFHSFSHIIMMTHTNNNNNNNNNTIHTFILHTIRHKMMARKFYCQML